MEIALTTEPCEDMTAFELATILLKTGGLPKKVTFTDQQLKELPLEIRRHFSELKDTGP